jgi:hypothetical protein
VNDHEKLIRTWANTTLRKAAPSDRHCADDDREKHPDESAPLFGVGGSVSAPARPGHIDSSPGPSSKKQVNRSLFHEIFDPAQFLYQKGSEIRSIT